VKDGAPDIELLKAYDDDEWLIVERAFCGRLLAYVARRISDPQAREDIVQEAFLGAVRGIGSFDKLYTFEQYLFGICRNRMIDYLRRNRMPTLGGDDEDGPTLETLVRDEETPSRIIRGEDLAAMGEQILIHVLRDWVQETWEAGEFRRLMVIEALFSGGWRNRDTWERFELRDETAVAGIKFRALKRLRDLAATRDPSGRLLPSLAGAIEEDGKRLDLDVSRIWREGHVSCPARYWLARRLAGTLREEGPVSFLDFHLGEMSCEWCRANLDDLERARDAQDLAPFLERVGASTMQFLRSQIRD